MTFDALLALSRAAYQRGYDAATDLAPATRWDPPWNPETDPRLRASYSLGWWQGSRKQTP